MSINVIEQTEGSYILTREMWCDGGDSIRRKDGKEFGSMLSIFYELVRLERKIIELGGDPIC